MECYRTRTTYNQGHEPHGPSLRTPDLDYIVTLLIHTKQKKNLGKLVTALMDHLNEAPRRELSAAPVSASCPILLNCHIRDQCFSHGELPGYTFFQPTYILIRGSVPAFKSSFSKSISCELSPSGPVVPNSKPGLAEIVFLLTLYCRNHSEQTVRVKSMMCIGKSALPLPVYATPFPPLALPVLLHARRSFCWLQERALKRPRRSQIKALGRPWRCIIDFLMARG